MNTITASLLAAALVLVALPTATADAALPECVDEGEEYCVFVEDGALCVRYWSGDMDQKPQTVCQALVPASVDGKLLCPHETDLCFTVSGGNVCWSVFLGDLEGPYTGCVGAVAATGAALGCVGVDGHYCAQIKDGQLCITTNTGDLEGPRTTCYDIPSVTTPTSVDVAGCVPFEGRYCVDAKKGCVTYDVGDLEGPRTWCIKGESSTSAGTICTYDLIESVSACIGNGCVTVYLGPAGHPVCVALAEIPERCTYHLIESVSACVSSECVTVFLGPSGTPVCLEASTSTGAPRICTLDYFLVAGVCIENGCTTVWAGMYPVRVCPQN